MGIRGSRSFTWSAWLLIMAFLVVGLSGETCSAKDDSTNCTFSCGNIHNISYPFRLKDSPKHCGHVMYTLSCENDTTVVDLPPSGKYYVQAINYDNHTIRIIDPGLQNNNCSSMSRNFPLVPSTLDLPYSFYGNYTTDSLLSTVIFYLKCSNPMNSSLYVDTAPCFDASASSSSQPKTYSYVKVGLMEVGDLDEGCSAEWMTSVLSSYIKDYNTSYENIHKALMYGFELRVYSVDELGPICQGQWSIYHKCFPHSIPGFFRFLWEAIYDFFARGRLYVDNPLWFPGISFRPGWAILICLGLYLVGRLLLGVPFLIAFLIYRWRRRHLSGFSIIEDFLQTENNFMPIRYSYLDIKRMTNKFKDKLGQGGYGSVFKGKLRSGRFVAIKLLGKPKNNGQDFTSEVATIGRIHHVNVVQLVGYCVEGSKRALVYDFMPNSSLDKYVYSKEGSIPLSCKKMYEIAFGVARGIEYLHQGCDMQILHFDIKPHNILLDENFNPKISDFGLAKLYPIDNSIVTLTAARGTIGYIAPELFYKNIGGVSYKADVYSFGMLLMEMASRRKNFSTTAEHSSQDYFPLWAYDQYSGGNDLLEMGNVTEEEKIMIKKMVMTAFWCIQMKPSDRPSMDKVIQMLGGDVENLKLPPKPFLNQQEMPGVDIQGSLNPKSSNGEITWSLSAR
ncbi:receptor-like protein kinase [Pyrus ussuriensis x Pyrus communis]|uniref:Receptor-like protein kinase n=1 Tax=Pyrus ussuriensis x Pyrus communis TaxID=2448454 RepID=A0A5N5EYG4_9ROSA|nr:receptor-like protein kinase [Pyrus ussuriensis x Pyrus communis]